MTKDEALLMALEALDGGAFGKELERVVLALRAALEEQPAEQQEPVAWMCSNKKLIDKGYLMFTITKGGDWDIPVYTSPQAKPWVGLTDKEIEVCLHHVDTDGIGLFAFARDIEAKLKEKNA